MKFFQVVVLFLITNNIFANLYITTSFFQDTERKPIVTKHHLFLNKPYEIRYWNMTYYLTLKKVSKELVQIDHETYLVVPLRKDFLSAGIWSGKFENKMELKQFSKNGKLKFNLIVIPEKIVN